jgi:hypothetical protein
MRNRGDPFKRMVFSRSSLGEHQSGKWHPSVHYRGVPIYEKFKNDFHKLKLSRDSVNGSVNSSMRKREGEIYQIKHQTSNI